MAVRNTSRTYKLYGYKWLGKFPVDIKVAIIPNPDGIIYRDKVKVYEEREGHVDVQGMHVAIEYWQMIQNLVAYKTGLTYPMGMTSWRKDKDGNYVLNIKSVATPKPVSAKVIKPPYAPIEFAKIEVQYGDENCWKYNNLFQLIRDMYGWSNLEEEVQSFDPEVEELAVE